MKLNKKVLIVVILVIILILVFTILLTKRNNINADNKNPDLSTITNNSDKDEIVIDKTDIIPNEQTEKELENSNISNNIPVQDFKNKQDKNQTQNENPNTTNSFNIQEENNNSQLNTVNSYYNENDNKNE